MKDRLRELAAAAVLLAGVLAVYCPPSLFAPDTLLRGLDYGQLHAHRIAFAREALLGESPHLPGWYPRELMGMPFRANVQNFPFVPTRPVLLAFEPRRAYAVAVNLAAGLAALFTFLYARRLGLGRVASVAAGWTFACAGTFASRVLAGHLPLLEAYPVLPLLLWAAERALQAQAAGRSVAGALLLLAFAGFWAASAGHPQLSAYALLTCGLYIPWRRPDRRAWRPLVAMALGVGSAAFSLWPMARLVGRSTRLLELAPPGNDIALPLSRLRAFVQPWRDGWPAVVAHAGEQPFVGHPNAAYFWDTVNYVGLLPLAAGVGLLLWLVLARRRPDRVAVFFAAAGTLALVFALPFSRGLWDLLPGVVLRSPARQLYVTIFVLALALGAGTQLLMRTRRVPWIAAACTLLALHAVDLGRHDRAFVVTSPAWELPDPLPLLPGPPEGRVVVQAAYWGTLERRADDVGFFDSVLLEGPYRALMAFSHSPPDRNVQLFSADALPRPALAYLGVRGLVTRQPRPDLEPVSTPDRAGPYRLFRVPGGGARAGFVAAGEAQFVPPDRSWDLLRSPLTDLSGGIRLPESARSALPAEAPARDGEAEVVYRRPDSDHIALRVRSPGPGWLRVLESWDPGWSASVDGRPVAPVRADGWALALPLAAGAHDVELSYATPGAGLGGLVSLLCLAALAALVWSGRDQRGRRQASHSP